MDVFHLSLETGGFGDDPFRRRVIKSVGMADGNDSISVLYGDFGENQRIFALDRDRGADKCEIKCRIVIDDRTDGFREGFGTDEYLFEATDDMRVGYDKLSDEKTASAAVGVSDLDDTFNRLFDHFLGGCIHTYTSV